MDILIKGGTIYDGSGGEPFTGDLAITGEKIEAIGENLGHRAGRAIEAAGMAVCPGFVDIHSHSDYYLLANPAAYSKIMQGVTTEIGGNCGYSAAPAANELLEERMKTVGKELGLTLDWESTEGYFSRLEEQGISVNYGSFVGHNTVRGTVMGFANRAPTGRELHLMKREIERAMAQGALGFSSGLIYPPACFASTEELISLCKSKPSEGGVFACHIRSEGEQLIEALQEVVRVSEEADIPLQISHLKTSGHSNWAKIDRAFEIIEGAIVRGLNITCDRYPYLAGNTVLHAIMPSWLVEGNLGQRVERLKKGTEREKALRELREAGLADGRWKQVMISQVFTQSNMELEGLTLGEAAAKRKMTPEEFTVELFVQEEGRVDIILFTMCEGNLRRILAKPCVMIASDASARAHIGPLSRGKPHPRSFGTFVRALSKYSRDEGLLPLQEAIKKCTSMPCDKLGVKDRGRLKPDCYADVVVFDPIKLSDTATYTEPIKYPLGIEFVIVNGRITVERGTHTGARAGKVLRRAI